MTPQGHDDRSWAAWTAPSGEQLHGSVDYIAGCRAGWDALAIAAGEGAGFFLRGFTRGEAHAHKRPCCKFSSTCEHAHPDDIANHTNGDLW